MVSGRQRTFDKEEALHKAMEIFWLKGFSGASLSDLVEAMGINKPSLYAAFSNKETLFVSALKHYAKTLGSSHLETLTSPDESLQNKIRAYLESISNLVTNSTFPGGCFVANSTCEAGSGCLTAGTKQTVEEINIESRNTFIAFFENEKRKGFLASTASPEALADYLIATQFGIAIMARNNVTKQELQHVIETAASVFKP
ncbi:TetR/AcrR family transcriptional regulator [Marinomonas mediterranea]|jgi:Transcriptional regulator|uniref:Transcriptional regulator, TetR family n=1 Tax=Marinomonas mediterranea (strain ATCC 700492 / JCM 21426 / NBRC 103028 / MMB-1) TaxID=717774 RepID=F2K2J7_MARM1|nr:TetR/AcrR family transcriptional regulator [Marinomonas mediterranea]ADZ90042.1 transcriptional regulator, TetR family [Marinomonas mediterranea MMB-1]WCN16249.1 TetR family transcriptional regulator [Marinomonas mediterranea MMB-1]